MIKGKMQAPTEEILTEMENRFVLYPIKYNNVWNMYKKAEAAFWTAEELDLSKDLGDWEKLSENERYFVKHILAFFAGSDGIVNENLGVRFMNDVKLPEAKAFYGFQIAMENIHCVSADTQIYTRNGYVPIASVAGKKVDVWNGKEWSTVTPYKTATHVPTSLVTLSNGMRLRCTDKHRWINLAGERIETKDLTVGLQLTMPSYPAYHTLQDPEIFTNPRGHGKLAFARNDADYERIKFDCREQHFVPINYSFPTKAAWLTGAISQASINQEGITFQHDDLEFLASVQLMLTTLNIQSCIIHNKLTTDQYALHQLMDAGVQIPNHHYDAAVLSSYTPSHPLAISSVSDAANCDTYCFEEPIEHMGIFNGILTGNSETYSLLIDTYVKDPNEKYRLLNAINTIPCIKKKAEWALKWISDADASFAKRLVAFACVEGIFFSGAFCAIFWLKERGVLPGLCLSNEFISRDESLHTEFAVLLYSMLHGKLTQQTIHEIISEAVEIEDEFINESIPCNMLGMNSTLMSQYIKFVADRLVVQLGYDKIYGASNPFDFMHRINLDNKANFFEERNSQYSIANVGNKNSAESFVFATDGDF